MAVCEFPTDYAACAGRQASNIVLTHRNGRVERGGSPFLPKVKMDA